MSIILLSYPQIKARNHELLRETLDTRRVDYLEVRPHSLKVECQPGSPPSVVDPLVTPPAAVLHRTIHRHRSLVAGALGAWSNAGVVVMNSVEAATRSRDKFETTVRLAGAGLATVPSLVVDLEDLENVVIPWSMPVVVKPVMGVEGTGVDVVRDKSDLATIVLDAAGRARAAGIRESGYYLVQPFVGSGGFDYRGFVVGGRCVAAMKRISEGSEWRANLTLGARGESLESGHPVFALAETAVEVMGLDYGAVDVLESSDGAFVVNEVDAWGGFAGLQRVTGVDVAAAIVDYTLAKIEEARHDLPE